jgi:hypothetical protein
VLSGSIPSMMSSTIFPGGKPADTESRSNSCFVDTDQYLLKSTTPMNASLHPSDAYLEQSLEVAYSSINEGKHNTSKLAMDSTILEEEDVPSTTVKKAKSLISSNKKKMK